MRLLVASVLALTACSGAPVSRASEANPVAANSVAANPVAANSIEASPITTPLAPGPNPVGWTVRPLFCAYGGVGLVPVPTPPDYETMFVSQVFEIDNAGPPLSGVTLQGASLRDAAGAPLATMLRLDHFVDLSAEPAPDPTWGSFGVYLNGTGTPFDGTLPSGTTRLRIHYSISEIGMAVPDHCRAELGGLGTSPLVIEGSMDGAWPTS